MSAVAARATDAIAPRLTTKVDDSGRVTRIFIGDVDITLLVKHLQTTTSPTGTTHEVVLFMSLPAPRDVRPGAAA